MDLLTVADGFVPLSFTSEHQSVDHLIIDNANCSSSSLHYIELGIVISGSLSYNR